MAKRYVIIDIDGICFDPTDRLNRCKREDGTIDWHKAFSNEEVEKDPAIEGAAKATHRIDEFYWIVYMTGRSNCCFEATFQRLRDSNFAFARVVMREQGDFRTDHELKRDCIEDMRIFEDAHFVAAIDDDYGGRLKPMYESLGIVCFTSFEDFFASEIWQNKLNQSDSLNGTVDIRKACSYLCHNCYKRKIDFPQIPFTAKCPSCNTWYSIVLRDGMISIIELENLEVTQSQWRKA